MLGKIHHHWKECLAISKPTKFESDAPQACEGKAPQSCEKLRTFVWWGASFTKKTWFQTKNFYFCMTNSLRRTQNLNLWFEPENSRFEVRDRSRTSWHAQWLSCYKNTSGWRPWYQERLVLEFPIVDHKRPWNLATFKSYISLVSTNHLQKAVFLAEAMDFL